MNGMESGGPADGTADDAVGKTEADVLPADGGQAAEYIGLRALQLAQRAHAAGFAKLAYLLESAALEAGAEAAASNWRADGPEG